MPRLQPVPRSHDLCPGIVRRRAFHNAIADLLRFLCLLIFLLVFLLFPALPAHAAPQIWLPTPAGQAWTVLQGYGCGSHNSWDRYSLDLVSATGDTFGAPVRAAADGRIWSWTAKSGTLILEHGGGFYTMYTHMDSAVTTQRDLFVARGTVIGAVGARGAHGTPHLHFTAFTGDGPAASHRRSVPLSFGEGYDLPDVGGCSQHGGETLIAGGQVSALSAGVRFSSEAQAGLWYNADKQVTFNLPAGTRGFSQAWNREPNGDAPQFADGEAGFLRIAEAGEGLHTAQVRYWDSKGQSVVATFGPIGYDLTPPQTPPAVDPIALEAGAPTTIAWAAASDNASGVAGYRIYIGDDPNGESDWFSPAPQVEVPALPAGDHLLRIQSLDYAGNAGAWATVGKISVAE
ncbi:MAG TPA: M23 family metallopeptidase [Roseiflexaceae bacterium]|nr:M23 family metallopeptidase [Roseiflexaceae bacterium]